MIVQRLGRRRSCTNEGTRSNDELKAFSRVTPNKIVGHHINKLVQVICSSSLPFVLFGFFFCLKVGSSFQVLGETIHITSEYLSQEARA